MLRAGLRDPAGGVTVTDAARAAPKHHERREWPDARVYSRARPMLRTIQRVR